MKLPAFTVLIGLALATTAAAQGASSSKATSSGTSSKTQLSEVRSTVHELEGQTDKLSELLTQYRSLVEQRPQPEGSSPEAKKAHQDQLAKWDSAIERLLVRLDGARAVVVETTQRLEKSISGELPTALAKDVAKALNEAGAERANAEQVLVKNKSSRKSKPAKQAPTEKEPDPSDTDDLDL